MTLVDRDALDRAGEALGRDLPHGSVVWLTGPLGAGKTTLARAIARGRGVSGAATSPTYALVHHYHGERGDVYHVDCYRLSTPDAAADLDWETLAAADLLLIEWPHRAGPWAPRATCSVTLDHAGEELRQLECA
ncbi:MAG TPA: tRNA (adenosine(37)-N6)-threonylcarbamoyltransferase complex ATPase subunit type 1 TsaE [Gemmatimonadales bacterium]|jgi:tRNA threonylcarbamoyladenosine biosynthesis protein TsaE|nr:tRNA (adenosine(37)-N6)-threonylcarbamoyltransferase complex ATPase subunit type 1 TsaE [Gemmatimonadales bacterium]